MSQNLEKTYNPKEIEDKLYQKWCENKYFHAEVDRSKKPFTIVMPPPNITGKLHMGHALDNTMQDILIRYKRMQGYNALWIPGTDHASISTEVKVINKLKEEGIDKNDLGREGFLKRTWEWREEFPERIIAKGGTGRIKLFGVDGYNFADVAFDQNGGIDCALVNIVPLKQPTAPQPSAFDTKDTVEAPAAIPKQPDPVDPQVWYEVQGRKVLEALITDLHSRGYNSLTIRENGDIAIQQADREKVRTAFESVPEKTYWARLCKVFEREGMAANITDGGILLSW